MLSEIVPLIHLNEKSNEEYFDGTGFLTILNGQPALVTCKHNLPKEEGVTSYFLYKDIKYPIDFDSVKYEEGNQANFPIEIENIITWSVFVDDYAFLKLEDGLINNPIPLGTTTEVSETEDLILITHDVKTGNQITFPCKRHRTTELARVWDESINGPLEKKNLITLICDGIEHGHSGGVVLQKKDAKCIGFLHSGSREAKSNHIHIIKSQTILSRYEDLFNE